MLKAHEIGTNHIVEQQRLRLACTNLQIRQSLCCLHTHSMDVDEDSDFRFP